MNALQRTQTLPAMRSVPLFFVPPVPLVDVPIAISPLARTIAPKGMRIAFDPNMKIGEDDDTLDIADFPDALSIRARHGEVPTPSNVGLVAFVGLLAFGYLVAMGAMTVVAMAMTGSHPIAVLHQLRAAI